MDRIVAEHNQFSLGIKELQDWLTDAVHMLDSYCHPTSDKSVLDSRMLKLEVCIFRGKSLIYRIVFLKISQVSVWCDYVTLSLQQIQECSMSVILFAEGGFDWTSLNHLTPDMSTHKYLTKIKLKLQSNVVTCLIQLRDVFLITS